MLFFKPKLGTKKRPIIIHVQSQQRVNEIAAICNQHGWTFIARLEPDKPENIDDFEKALRSPFAQHATPAFKPEISRNDYCPCKSNLKYKNCCGKNKV